MEDCDCKEITRLRERVEELLRANSKQVERRRAAQKLAARYAAALNRITQAKSLDTEGKAVIRADMEIEARRKIEDALRTLAGIFEEAIDEKKAGVGCYEVPFSNDEISDIQKILKAIKDDTLFASPGTFLSDME